MWLTSSIQYIFLSFSVVQKPKSGPGCLIVEVSVTHTHTAWLSERVISSSQRPIPTQKMNISMHFAGFEPAIPAIQRFQPTYSYTARPPASQIWYSYWTVLTATLLPRSRVIEGRLKNTDFLGHVMKANVGA